MQAADDAQGDGPLEAVGRPQGDRPIPDVQRTGIAEGSRLQARSLRDPDHRQIGHGVNTQHRALEFFSAGQGHLNPFGTIDNVGIRQNHALAIDHDPGALAAFAAIRDLITKHLPQQGVTKGGIQPKAGNGSLGIDPHDRRTHPLYGRRDETVVRGPAELSPGRSRRQTGQENERQGQQQAHHDPRQPQVRQG